MAAFAQPNPNDPRDLCHSLGRRRTQAFALDLSTLCDLRENKEYRGFTLPDCRRMYSDCQYRGGDASRDVVRLEILFP